MRDEIRNTNIEIRNKFKSPKFKARILREVAGESVQEEDIQ